MAKGLQATIGVDRQLPVEIEDAVEHVLVAAPALGEPEVLHQHELGGGEAVMYLGHRDLRAGIADAGLAVGVLGAAHDLGEGRVVIAGVQRAFGGARRERQRLHVDRAVGVAMGVFGSDDERGRRPVGDARAVEDPHWAGDQRRAGDRLPGHLLAELRPRVLGPVDVVLPGDARHDLLHDVLVDPVLLAVGGRQQREHRRGGEVGVGAVAGHARQHQARVARVLELLDTDRHHDVVGAGGDRIARVAEGLRPRRAVVLDPGDRLVVDLQRAAEREP